MTDFADYQEQLRRRTEENATRIAALPRACGRCAFWLCRDTPPIRGACRLNGPIISTRDEDSAAWPKTWLDDWCGQFADASHV